MLEYSRFSIIFLVSTATNLLSIAVGQPEQESDATVRYKARVRVYADKAGVDEFIWNNPGGNLTEHVNDMFVCVNKAYRSLLPELDIVLHVESVIALDKNIFKHTLDWKGDLAIINDWTGYEFWEWAKKTYDPTKYDLAVLLTGYEMYSRGSYDAGTFGHGYTGSACTPNGVAAVEIQQPEGLLGLIHEIGHVLGAEHDEQGPKELCTPDTYQKGNIMNEFTRLNSPLRFTFSKCSQLQMKKYFDLLTKSHRNCLSFRLPALNTTADEVCEETKGEGWRMNRHDYDTYGDILCEKVVCAKNDLEHDRRLYFDMEAPDGLMCGQNKRCYNRKCILVTNGDNKMSDACPWGSQDDDYVTATYGYPCARLGCDGEYSKMCCGHCKL